MKLIKNKANKNLMAFPNINAQQETNKKILEDLQLKKQLLQKEKATLLPTAQIPSTTQDAITTVVARSTWTAANSQSFGFFIIQDSIFGNSILPVLPRFDNPQK